METRAHHVLIGLFTVLVIVGAMLFGLWLAKASMDSTPKGTAVNRIHGRNLPQRVLVRSARMPTTGVNTNAPSRPTTNMIVAAVPAGIRYTSV